MSVEYRRWCRVPSSLVTGPCRGEPPPEPGSARSFTAVDLGFHQRADHLQPGTHRGGELALLQILPSPRSRVRHAGPASGPHVPPACPARVRPAQAVPSRAARRTRSSDRSCSQRFPVCSGVLADTHDQPRGRSQAGDGHPTSTNTGGTSTLTGTMKLRGSHSWLAGRRTQQVDDVSLEIHRRCQGL